MTISKIFKKTFFLVFLLFGVISISTSILAGAMLYSHMTEEYISKARAIARSIAGSSVDILLNRDAATIQSMIDQYLEIQGVAYVFVIDAKGQVLSHTFVPAFPDVLAGLEVDRHGMKVAELNVPKLGAVIDVAKPILDGVAGYVHVGMDGALILKYITQAIVNMQILMFFIFWGCVLVLYLMVGRVSRPLTLLTEYAGKLAAHDFAADVTIDSKDEIGLLAGTMKSMAKELSGLVTGLERAVFNATSELQDTLAYMRAIIDNLVDGLLVIDVTGRLALSNPAFAEMLGIEGRDLKGKEAKLFFTGAMVELIEKSQRCGHGVVTAEVPLARGGVGKAVGTSIQKLSAAHQGGMCLGTVILVRDITLEKELDLMKTDFISTVSHELRTPMTSILGFAKIIRKRLDKLVFPALPPGLARLDRAKGQIEENLGIIVAEGERLTELINDLLDIAKMESGKVEWRMRDLSVAEILDNSASATAALAESKGLTLRVERPADPLIVTGDRDRLIQVMVNLISNAVKFTPKGQVEIGAREQDGKALIYVRDTGIGIARKDQEKIFDRFKQAGDTLTEKPVGTGLGLPICKQIVEHHGGSVRVESEIGLGSTFSFALSLKARTDQGEEDCERFVFESSSSQSNLVMVVDDDPSLSAYLTQILLDEGFRVVCAGNGAEAVRLAREKRPDLITMDLLMPGMDGVAAIARLRQDPDTAGIPVVVISALTESGSAGGDAALVKPVDEARLLATIDGLLGRAKAGYDGPCLVVRDAAAQARSDKILVVCEGEVATCLPGEVRERIEAGFRGTVFIPADLAASLDLAGLSRDSRINLVILPSPSGLA
jgi:PAS domain S-box-containing protein